MDRKEGIVVMTKAEAIKQDRNRWRDMAHHLAMITLQSDLYEYNENARIGVDDILHFYGSEDSK